MGSLEEMKTRRSLSLQQQGPKSSPLQYRGYPGATRVPAVPPLKGPQGTLL